MYRAYETTVRLYDHDYRAIVVHSSAHDKRRHKRIDRLLAKKRKELDALCKKIRASTYYCRADAQAAADKLQAASGGAATINWIAALKKLPNTVAVARFKVPHARRQAMSISCICR